MVVVQFNNNNQPLPCNIPDMGLLGNKDIRKERDFAGSGRVKNSLKKDVILHFRERMKSKPFQYEKKLTFTDDFV